MKNKMNRKNRVNRVVSTLITLALVLCHVCMLSACGRVDVERNKATIEELLPDSMDTNDVADMLESGMSVDEIIDRVEEEIQGSNAPSTDKPAETANPTQTEKPTATPSPTAEPTAKPTPEPTETPKTPEPTPTPHVHQYKVESSTEATCSADGKVVKVCACGERQVEVTPPTGNHNWVEGTKTIRHEALGHVEVVRTQTGTTETRHEYECSYCGFRADTPSGVVDHQKANMADGIEHALARTIIYDYPGEPIYEETQVWQVDQEAWDEVVGNGTYTCSNCGATK